MSTVAVAQPEKRGLPWIQTGRGAAALLVVLAHTSLNMARYVNAKFLGDVFGESRGNIGVDFFFVLSGFIILHVHRADIGHSARLPNYARKRFSRVVPLYWMITALLLPAFFLAPKLVKGFDGDWFYVVRSFLLLPQDELPILGVGWTLTHEAYFYLLFSLCIASPRRVWLPVLTGVMALTVWKLGCDFGQTFHGTKYQTGRTFLDGSVTSAFLFSRHNIEFAAGALVALMVNRVRLPNVPALTLIGCLLFLAPMVLSSQEIRAGLAILGDKSARTIYYTIVSAGLIVCLVQLTTNVPRAYEPPRWSRFLGDASYSLYLIHYPVLVAVFVALKATHLIKALPPTLTGFIALTTAVIGGLLCYRFVEKPLLARTRGSSKASATSSSIKVGTTGVRSHD